MLGQKDESKKDKFIDTMPTIIQMHLITEKVWAVTTKKAKELEHIIRKCDPPAAALPILAKGTTVPSLYSHIAHSNDKDEEEIPQPFKGAHPKQPKPKGRGKGKQPQQKPKTPPSQTQEDQYNYEDTNNYYHNENYRGQFRGRRPYRGQNTGRSFRGQIFVAEVKEIRTHTKANIKMTGIKAIITRVIVDFIIIHIEISLKVIVMVNRETEAVAEAITTVMVVVGPIIKAMLITSIISIMFMMISTRWINAVHHALYAVVIITLPNTVLKESTISMILWKRLILTAINHSLVVYIPKGEHDNPHELSQQQDLEGSTKIDHTLYSHVDTITPTPNSSQKLEYIYQHFQENEKVYESDPNLATDETDDTLYPHITTI